MTGGVDIHGSRLSGSEVDAMAAVAARAFCDDPLAVAVFARAAAARQARLRSVYAGMLRAAPHPPLSAWSGGAALGLVGLNPPHSPSLSPRRLPRALPDLLRGARGFELAPALAWLRAMAGAGAEPGDWRLGPVVVDPGAHGRGIGSAIVEAACSLLDRDGAAAVVSTDVVSNVSFYCRFGFERTGAGEVLGLPVWHLRRRPRRASGPG